MKYHAFGDSNVIYNFFTLPLFIDHHLGSVRMRDIADGTTPLDIRQFGVEPGDVCFFSAGEIDIRSDFHKIAIAASDAADGMIAVLVRRYLDVVAQNRIEGVAFWIVAVLPPAYVGPLPDWIRYHPCYPYIGPDAKRAAYTVTMNRELREQGAVAGFRFLDIHRRYADERNMLRPDLSSYMHVADNRPVLAELYEAGLYPTDRNTSATIADATGLVEIGPDLDRVTDLFRCNVVR